MSNTERFTGRADTYDRYRQRYPAEEILSHLRDWNVLTPHAHVADIGAGTGMLTEVFLVSGNPIIAIEPNQEMRSTCERLITRFPSLTLLNATAEATTLADASIDIVAAGRAFHWFNIPRALTEFRRILKPQGWVVLVSLGRAKGDTPQANAFEQILTTHGTDYTTYVRAGYRIHENLHEVFAADMHQAMHQAEVPGQQHLDWDAFLGQTMSLSVTPQPSDPRHAAFTEHLRDYFQTYAVNGILTAPTTCWITAGQLGI